MPSIALFIKELLSEDDSQRDGKMHERIKQLNAAQLQGMHNHLLSTAHKAKSPMWKLANEDLLKRIEEMLAIRIEEDQLEKRLLEDMKLKKKQKIVKEREARREQKRVMEMVAESAHKKAEEEVKENEQKRQASERVSILQRVFQAEEKRNSYWKVIAFCYVVIFVGAIIFLASVSVPILIGVLGGVTILALVAAYKAHTLTHIKPTLITPEELLTQVQQREDVLKKQAVMALREKERKFEEQQKKDREEAKKRRAVKREREKFEAELLAKQRAEQLKMAQEIFSRSMSQDEYNKGDKGLVMQSLSASPSNSEGEDGDKAKEVDEGEEADDYISTEGEEEKKDAKEVKLGKAKDAVKHSETILYSPVDDSPV
ncbi:hypothetical protein EON65_08970 [archaeon]|nr:MAG: hypothetical protein EON65_08970 [archaeon]